LLTRRIDQAAAKGVIHKNSAARKKSQVAHILARLPG
jgi:ribosomal protein S20